MFSFGSFPALGWEDDREDCLLCDTMKATPGKYICVFCDRIKVASLATRGIEEIGSYLANQLAFSQWCDEHHVS